MIRHNLSLELTEDEAAKLIEAMIHYQDMPLEVNRSGQSPLLYSLGLKIFEQLLYKPGIWRAKGETQ